MIEKMIAQLRQRLPLIIDSISWDENILNIYDDGRNFATLSSWGVLSKPKVILECYGTKSKGEIFSIRNEKWS